MTIKFKSRGPISVFRRDYYCKELTIEQMLKLFDNSNKQILAECRKRINGG